MNKKINLFKEFTLGELLDSISKEFLVQVQDEGSRKVDSDAGFCEVIVDKTHQNEVGFYDGPHCIASLSLKDILKIIDYDTVKVIKSEENYNLGFILKFYSVTPYKFF